MPVERCDNCGNRAYWIAWYNDQQIDASTVCRGACLHLALSRLEMARTPGTHIKVRQVGR